MHISRGKRLLRSCAMQDTAEAIKATALADIAHERLTLKRQAFVHAYLVNGGNATDAYHRSHNCEKMGYAAIRVEACRLLKRPNITLAIERYRNSEIVGTMLTIEQHMSELRELRDAAKASGQLSAAIRAEELRGKLRGFYVEKVEHGAPNDFAAMSDEELRQFIVEQSKAPEISIGSAWRGKDYHGQWRRSSDHEGRRRGFTEQMIGAMKP
jgi:hypothetical protein